MHVSKGTPGLDMQISLRQSNLALTTHRQAGESFQAG